jgi:hypothetical protein
MGQIQRLPSWPRIGMQACPSLFASAALRTFTAPNRAAVRLWQAMTGAVLDFDWCLLIRVLPILNPMDQLSRFEKQWACQSLWAEAAVQ